MVVGLVADHETLCGARDLGDRAEFVGVEDPPRRVVGRVQQDQPGA
jgi:hypothetical protein